MTDAPHNDENMEYRMKISLFNCKKYYTERIKKTAEKHEQKAVKPYAVYRLNYRKNNRPSHADVRDHSEYLVFFEIYRRKRYPDDRKSPYHREGRPRGKRIIVRYCADKDRSVRTSDQKIYRAMIHYLKDLFCRIRAKSVVNT